MRLAILFTGADSLCDTVAVGRAAEAAGFDALYMVEAYRSAWVALSALAAATERVTLGPYVLNAYARSPMLTAMTAADFQELSQGRLHLGIGGGNRLINEQWQGIPHTRVLTKMREYVEILRIAARTPAGQPIAYDGAVHQMHWTPRVAPATPYPISLAAIFPKMLAVAASIADGIAGGATLSPEFLSEFLRPTVAAHAAKADRDPAAIEWRAVMFAAVSDDRAAAYGAARAGLCALFAPLPHPYYEYTMTEQGYGEVVERLRRLVPAGRLDAAIEAIPDAMVERFTIAGTLAECRARLAAYDDVLDEILLSNVMPVGAGGWQAAYAGFLRLAQHE
ncbi:MAG: LLM class flavin-dependent oxidoreductase [Gammaproteobacteria bacterium]